MAQDKKFDKLEELVKEKNHHIGVVLTVDLDSRKYRLLSYGLDKKLCGAAQQVLNDIEKALKEGVIIIPD